MRAKPVNHISLDLLKVPALFANALLAYNFSAVSFDHTLTNGASLSLSWHSTAYMAEP